MSTNSEVRFPIENCPRAIFIFRTSPSDVVQHDTRRGAERGKDQDSAARPQGVLD